MPARSFFVVLLDAKAVITGAARGIGKTLALGMAKRGADVIVADIHGDEVAAVCEQIRGMDIIL